MKLAALAGLSRSLLMYYAIPGRASAWRRFYGQFIAPGDLCFDIGAHAGNRTRAMLVLGSNVLAVEPQPLFARTLMRLYGSQKNFKLLETAVASYREQQEMMISTETPTVSSISREWAQQMAETPGFAQVHWDARLPVNTTTLDTLIADHGLPAFCKIDVEGAEPDVLNGLSQPIRAISFEYIPAAMDLAMQGLKRLTELGDYVFNLVSGEYPRFALKDWTDAKEIREKLAVMPKSGCAGEIFSRMSH